MPTGTTKEGRTGANLPLQELSPQPSSKRNFTNLPKECQQVPPLAFHPSPSSVPQFSNYRVLEESTNQGQSQKDIDRHTPSHSEKVRVTKGSALSEREHPWPCKKGGETGKRGGQEAGPRQGDTESKKPKCLRLTFGNFSWNATVSKGIRRGFLILSITVYFILCQELELTSKTLVK